MLGTVLQYPLIIAALALLAACGSAKHDAPPPPVAPAKKTVFEPLVNQLDYVKQQAETLPQERKENLDAAIAADEQ